MTVQLQNPTKAALRKDLDDLTEFRTVWLRAVAQAWIDPTFSEALIKDPEKALEDKFQFRWPWKGNLDLSVSLEEDFKWVGDTWAWPDDEEREEGLVLYVPLEPPHADTTKHAVALADYYRQRPGLLVGTPSGSPGGVDLSVFRLNGPVATAFMDRMHPAASGGGMRFASPLPPSRGFAPNPVDFLDFGIALTSIMARAWENREFREVIQEHRNFKGALNTVRGYSPPWALNLVVKHDLGENGRGTRWEENVGWTNLSAYKLLLHLPAAPSQPRDQSIALASYNATGAEFFATCCV